jgi:hypothetical protein
LDNILGQDDELGVDQEDYSFQSVLSSLDQIVRQWTRIENTGPLIQLVYSTEQLDALVTDPNPAIQEFGLIMLRLSLVDAVPDGAIPFLEFLFGDYFENASFLARRHVAKIFLQILPYMGLEMCAMIVSIGIRDKIRECIDSHLSEAELVYYDDGFALLDEFFLDEETDELEIAQSDGNEPLHHPDSSGSAYGSPILSDVESVIAMPAGPEPEFLDGTTPDSCTEGFFAAEQLLPVFSCWDHFACQWATLEKTGGLIREIYSLDQLNGLVTDPNPAIQEFGLIMLRLAFVREVPDVAIPFLAFLFGDYFENASFLARRHVAKIFLQILPYMGLEMCENVLALGIEHKIHECIDGNLSEIELVYYGEGLAVLDQFFLESKADTGDVSGK